MLRPSSSDCKFLFLLFLHQMPLMLAASQLHCEMLPTEECAFAVDSSGRRCVLREDSCTSGGRRLQTILSCETSNIFVGDESPTEYIENDQCVRACGVEKTTVGFVSNTKLSRDNFLAKLCSRECKRNCPNLVDLYSTVAMVVGKQGYLTTYMDLCHDLLHKSRKLVRFSQKP